MNLTMIKPRFRRSHISLPLLLGMLLSTGCEDREATAAAQAAAQAARNEQMAAAAEREFDAAVMGRNWHLAKSQADVLIANWPETEAAARVREQFAQIKAKAEAEREARRLAALWSYNVQAVKGGQQRSAAIYARDDLDVDGRGPRPVQLIFRDHPDWGRSSYLVLRSGDFARACYKRCQVKVRVDDAAPRTMNAFRPDTDEAIAMFITDDRTLWRQIREARVLSIEFQVKDGTRRTAVFEIAGLERSRLPGWG